MGFHGVQLLGLALVGFGIYVEIRHIDSGGDYTNYFPHLGLLLTLVGGVLDPMLNKKLKGST